jgi:hypothetical protein
MMRGHALRSWGLTPEDLTVTFDYPTPDSSFRVDCGRNITREGDGFYHVTIQEWGSFRGMNGITLIEGADR